MDGLVRRSPDPADRRAKILTITPDGARELAKAQRARDRARGVFFGVLSDNEKKKLAEMLERMHEAAQSLDQ